jgi:hypothetical protein
MKKRSKVHRLPTEESYIYYNSLRNELINTFDWGDEDMFNFDWNDDYIPQHLYFTADEEVKIGEHCIYGGKIITWCNIDEEGWNKSIQKPRKIIATTDPKFTKKKCSNCNGEVHIYKDGFRDCHCETGEVYDIPQPTQDFIKAYCEQGGIDEVDVEYYDTDSAACVMIEPKDKSKGCINCNDEDGRCTTIKKLKLNSDNTIITHLIEQKNEIKSMPMPKELMDVNIADMMDQEILEFEKCKDSLWYFMTKYMVVNGKPFTTHLSEEDFNNKWMKENL